MKINIFGILLFLLLSCNNNKAVTDSLLTNIPNNSALVIRINDFDLFQNELKNNNFLKEYQKTNQFAENSQKTNLLSKLKPNSESVLCFVEVGTENFDFFFKTKTSENLVALKENQTFEKIPYEQGSYNKIVVEDQNIFTYNLNNYTYISSSSLLIENLIRTKEPLKLDETLLHLFNASNKNKSATFLIPTKYSSGILNSVINKKNAPKLSEFSDWVSLDATIEQNELKLSGISSTNANSTVKFVDLFKNIKPVYNLTQKFAPINAKGIASYTFEKFDDFNLNQQKYLGLLAKKDTLFSATQELGIAYINDKRVVILQTYNSENLVTLITKNTTESSTYQGNDIIKLSSETLLKTFQPILLNFKTNYATVLDNAILFSEDVESLENTINNYKNDATFDKSSTFLSAKSSIADESNILLIESGDGIQEYIQNDFKNSISKNISTLDLSNYVTVAQIVSDNNFYHTSILLKKVGAVAESNITAPLFTVRLDSDIATQPQFVKNHSTKKHEIVVQDQDNILYLISPEGKVLWKKQINGRIKGSIQQVDLYKNGRLQLAFITDTQFIILDRNGDNVKPFDITFKGDVLSSLSVFDYDSNRDYRFLLAQGSKLLMYNNKGEIVSGFKFKESGKKITNTPQHFRTNKKDFIVFGEEDGTLRILNRVGDDRITVKDKIDFSANDIFLYKNKFTTTDDKGKFFQIDEKGTLTSSNLGLTKDHGLYATSNVLVTMNENTLTIKGKKVDLELGVYTNPHVFYKNNKVYVSVTDIQNQKIYLFDSNADAIQNFPIYGSSLIDLEDIDNDKKLELVAKDLENSLIVYKIN